MSDKKATDALSKVLSYVDSPFKLFALLLMAVFAFSGYFIWQNQSFLFEAYKENKKLPTIAEDRSSGRKRRKPSTYHAMHIRTNILSSWSNCFWYSFIAHTLT